MQGLFSTAPVSGDVNISNDVAVLACFETTYPGVSSDTARRILIWLPSLIPTCAATVLLHATACGRLIYVFL